jgi:thioredoxin 1
MYAATCPYCLATTPDLMKLADDLSVHIDQFNLLEFKSYQQKYNIEYTPTLVYFEDGVEKERIVGGLSEDSSAGNTIEDYKAFFERHQGE